MFVGGIRSRRTRRVMKRLLFGRSTAPNENLQRRQLAAPCWRPVASAFQRLQAASRRRRPRKNLLRRDAIPSKVSSWSFRPAIWTIPLSKRREEETRCAAGRSGIAGEMGIWPGPPCETSRAEGWRHYRRGRWQAGSGRREPPDGMRAASSSGRRQGEANTSARQGSNRRPAPVE